jgi:UDP-N-acetylglucosamine:LPS N-acetylglucosamine transferase
VIVEDNPAHPADTTQALQQVLFELMGDSGRLEKMAEAARSRSGLNASERIARLLLGL